MSNFKSQLLNILSEIKGSGYFVSTHDLPFTFPGLEVSGIDEISFPVNNSQVKELIKVAHKAPFGKGSETVLDPTVRSAWEINADQIVFNNKDWPEFINSIIGIVKPDLGLENHSVSANLYKLLIYEEGDFFLKHKDSEKEKGMFGTLIIGLPSKHTGGELTVSFDGKSEVVDFSEAAYQYRMPFTAFYADCEHEITPVTSGYRVCLIYNLVQESQDDKVKVDDLGTSVKQIIEILKDFEEEEEIPRIILLGHEYTPSSFTMDGLKLNDRHKADALIRAAEEADYYVKLGLVTSYQMGELETDYDPYSYRYRNNNISLEDGTMGAIHEEYMSANEWMKGGIPPLQAFDFNADDLIHSLQLNEGEPTEKNAEGFTGNAGMEMEYWYHYGAVFLWPKKHHYFLLTDEKSESKLEWIRYFNKHWKTISSLEKETVQKIIEDGLSLDSRWIEYDFSPIADWLILLEDENYLAEKGTGLLIQYFEFIQIDNWLKLFNTYPSRYFENVFTTAAEKAKNNILVEHHFTILTKLQNRSSGYATFLETQITQIPSYVNALDLTKKEQHGSSKNILKSVLKIGSIKAEDPTWVEATANAFAKELSRKYVNNVLVDIILENKDKSALGAKILAICKKDLMTRVQNKPIYPQNWSMPFPEEWNGYENEFSILKSFLISPTQEVFDYARIQADRTIMEDAIRRVNMDLRMETIRKGSPHTLRLTKTHFSYELKLIEWKTDEALLKTVKEYTQD